MGVGECPMSLRLYVNIGAQQTDLSSKQLILMWSCYSVGIVLHITLKELHMSRYPISTIRLSKDCKNFIIPCQNRKDI